MRVNSEQYQMEAEVANMVSVFVKEPAGWMIIFLPLQGIKAFRKSFFSHILTLSLLKQMILLL